MTIPDMAATVDRDLVEVLVVAACGVLVGADTFVEIALWAREKLGELRGFLRLAHGIPSHNTFGSVSSLIVPVQSGAAFRA